MAKSKLAQANKKIAEAVVGTYQKIEDKFIEQYLTCDGETVEQAKTRLKEQSQ